MIRRTVLAAVALSVMGGVAAPAMADVINSSPKNDYLCILGTNHTTGVKDGICIWIPTGTTK
jgi:hypothetical protein